MVQYIARNVTRGIEGWDDWSGWILRVIDKDSFDEFSA